MDAEEIAKLANIGLGAAINILVAAVGIAAARDMVGAIQAKMVKDGRGPTEAEIDLLAADLMARGQRIQDA